MEENPIQPPQPVQQQIESNPPPIKKSFPKLPLIITAVLIILVLSLPMGGYLILNRLGIHPKPSTVTVRTTTPTPTPDETATWKTYFEKDYSIKIPNVWINADNPGLVRFLNYDENKAPGRDFNQQQDKGLLKIEISRTTVTEDLQTYVKSITTNNPGGEFTTRQLTVDGQPAIEITSGQGSYSVFVRVPSTNDVLSIGFYLDFANYRSLSNQILSTFKFTNQTSESPDTASWKTYANQKEKITFKYPQDFILNEGKSATYLVDMQNHALLTVGDGKHFGFGFTLGVYKNTGNLSGKQFIEQYYNDKYKDNLDASGQPIDPELKDIKFEEETINGVKVTFISGLMTVRGAVGPAVWLTNGTDGYFAICDNNGVSVENALTDLKEIFSTFKFTP